MEEKKLPVPKEIIVQSTTRFIDTEKTIYPFLTQKKGIRERLTISSTLPVLPANAGFFNAFFNDLEDKSFYFGTSPNTDSANLPNPHFWIDDHSDEINAQIIHYEVRIDNEIEKNYAKYPIETSILRDEKEILRTISDGVNACHKSIHANIDFNKKQSNLYLLTQPFAGDYKQEDILLPIVTLEGILFSLTLENEQNRIIYCSCDEIQSTVSIQDITNNALTLVATSKTVPVVFKKIINIGNTHCGSLNNLGDVYLCLTYENELYTLWHDKDKVIHYIQQKSDLRFRDIAVDNTEKCPSGFKPKVALLSTTGKLYITNLAQPGKQLLHCIHTIDENEIKNAHRISYDNGIVGIIYSHPEHGLAWGKYEQFKDNFSLLYAAYALTKKIC